MKTGLKLDRRNVLWGGGALTVQFALAGPLAAQDATEVQGPKAAPVGQKLPGSLTETPFLDSWIRVAGDGRIEVFTGKAELGQGVRTALLQIAAEELGVTPGDITLTTADTGRTPNEGYTAGSHSMQDSGTAIKFAAAQVRGILLDAAAEKLGVARETLDTNGTRVVGSGGQAVAFADLVSDGTLHVSAVTGIVPRDPKTYRYVGTPMQRVDIPAKMTGGLAYLQDLRLPGMKHARIIRQPTYAAELVSVDTKAAEAVPGFVKVIRDGNFLAVVADRQFAAIKAMRALMATAQWKTITALPVEATIYDTLLASPAKDYLILDAKAETPPVTKTVEAIYHRPYQLHGSIGPSCGLAKFEDGTLTVWSHAQGMFPLRKAISQMVKLDPKNVRCIHTEGSGCYGHNAADDAAADAAIIAMAMPGVPVKVQWMRKQEHTCEPYTPAMITKAKATLDDTGHIAEWAYEVWSNTHSMRPGSAGNLLAATQLATPFKPDAPVPLPQPEGGGDRNAIPLYHFGTARVMHHFLPEMPLRVSAMRGLGAYMNVFSIESFMDEVAEAAGADPVQFRLAHMEDSRARDVIARAAQEFGWEAAAHLPDGHGRGFAFARYKNLGAYCAIAMEIALDRETGRLRVVRVVAATDSGQIVNPDGIRNQIEGGIVQSLSWSMYETVSFTKATITSRDWSSYPILRFTAVPGSVVVHPIDRPGQPFLGTGEAAQGPTAAALGNALRAATKIRFRDLPFTAAHVKATIGA